jgi:hypothetical protein
VKLLTAFEFKLAGARSSLYSIHLVPGSSEPFLVIIIKVELEPSDILPGLEVVLKVLKGHIRVSPTANYALGQDGSHLRTLFVMLLIRS